jgi:NAD(P)-dependent dehydrogenase (short-subunit alcohol dehydrogenase family)
VFPDGTAARALIEMVENQMKLSGKVALVTGTSTNIGGGIAEGLAAEGAALVCVDARADNSADCARYIKSTGGRAVAVTCDVTDERQVAAAVAAARESFGGIDILVNNAAIFNKKGVLDMPLDEWRRQLEIILGGAFLFTKHVAKSMSEQGRKGSIINIISTAGHQGEPNNIAYCTAKSGLLNFTRSAAMELVAHGIRVNSLTPTATDPSESLERATRGAAKFAVAIN